MDWPSPGSANIGLVPDASLDLREKTLTEKPRCLTGLVLHPKEAKGEYPQQKNPVVSRAWYRTQKRLREKTLTENPLCGVGEILQSSAKGANPNRKWIRESTLTENHHSYL